MTNTKTLQLKDLNSLYSIKQWARENAGIFHGKNIDDSNMLIILNYLRETVKESDVDNKIFWFESIIDLEKKLEIK